MVQKTRLLSSRGSISDISLEQLCVCVCVCVCFGSNMRSGYVSTNKAGIECQISEKK